MVNVTMPADPLTVPGSTAADVELTDLGQTNAEVAYTNKPRTNWSGILLSVWAGISILGTFVWYVGVAPYFNMLCSQSNCTSIANATSIAIATYMTSNYTVTSRYPALTDTYATTTHATPTITTITFVTTVRATAISATESAALHRAAVWAAPTDVPTKKLDGQSTSWRGAVNYFLILYNVLTFLALCLIALVSSSPLTDSTYSSVVVIMLFNPMRVTFM